MLAESDPARSAALATDHRRVCRALPSGTQSPGPRKQTHRCRCELELRRERASAMSRATRRNAPLLPSRGRLMCAIEFWHQTRWLERRGYTVLRLPEALVTRELAAAIALVAERIAALRA